MEIIKVLPQELKWNVFKFMEHPVAALFKLEMMDELEEHFMILKEGPCYEINWCADDDVLFGCHALFLKKEAKFETTFCHECSEYYEEIIYCSDCRGNWQYGGIPANINKT